MLLIEQTGIPVSVSMDNASDEEIISFLQDRLTFLLLEAQKHKDLQNALTELQQEVSTNKIETLKSNPK